MKLLLKTSHFHLFFIFVCLFLIACDTGYENKDGNVTFNGDSIDVSNRKGFKMLNGYFAKDSLHGYYLEQQISASEGSSFKALDDFYAKDEKHAFYCYTRNRIEFFNIKHVPYIHEMEGINCKTMVSAGYRYAKDNRNVFHQGNKIVVKDVKTFKGIDENFAKDTFTVYFVNKPISQSLPQSFVVIDRQYAKDAGRPYYYSLYQGSQPLIRSIPGDPASFSILAYDYSKDKNAVFYQYKKIIQADPANFSVVSSYHGQDKQYAYYENIIIPNADVKTFKPIEGLYSKDHVHVFYKTEDILHADPASFQLLKNGIYGLDKNQVYYFGKVIENANAKTFQLCDSCSLGDAYDKDHLYMRGDIVKK